MRIKKITLNGFKSFADKTTLTFASGTSAIIGPNGCGKSNVVDAIRWVIGEQNARHLRGKNMEDIIFNGSEGRKPVGMAEVVLTFSNKEGRAPARFANFPEIEISRRLYRSGDSEYGINKVQCRLRDIVELFTDTGIGTRAYSIIEQGQVGWLVNAKPIERRVLFEEAAGINKYKQKKEAALRRLKATAENLTRVSDIVSEVKRQLNSLNRQAKKAERYKVVKEELKEIDLQFSSFEFVRMIEALEESRKSLAGISDGELALHSAIGTKEVESEESRESYTLEEEGFRAVKERVHSLEKKIQDEENTSALALMRIEELGRNETRLGAEIEELMRLKESTEREIVDGEGFIAEGAERIENEERVVGQKSAELDGLSGRLRDKEREEAECKAESLSVMTRLQDLRHAIQNCIKEEEQCRVTRAQAEIELEARTNECAELQVPAAKLRFGAEEISERRAGAETELQSKTVELASTEARKSGLEEELVEVKDSHARAAARLSTLEEMEKNFANVDKGTRSIMQKAGTEGIHGLLADVIEPNPGFERAVEAAMGSRLQCVIVESNKEGLEAIEYLKSSSGGRSAFVSVREARALPVLAATALGAVAANTARELFGEIKVKEGYAGVVESLMGATLVVDDLATALDIWSEEGLYRTIVTRAGEVVTPEGIITGGDATETSGETASTEATGGLLQRKSEVRAIKEREAELALETVRLSGDLSITADEVTEVRAGLEAVKERLHAIEIEGVNSSAELRAAEEEIARLESAKERLGTGIESARVRIEELGVNKTSYGEERDTLERNNFDNDGKIEAIGAETREMAAEKERLSAIVTELKVSLAQTTERHEQHKAQLGEKRVRITEVDTRMAKRSTEIEAGRAETLLKRGAVEAIKSSIEELLSGAESIRGEEISRKELIDGLTERIRGIDTELKRLNSELSNSRSRSSELTLAIAEVDLKITHLKEGIIERYGVDIEAFQKEAIERQTLQNEGAETETAEAEGTAPSNETEEVDTEAMEARRTELRDKITSMGEVSLSALAEFNELSERHTFLIDQQEDLQKSVDSLQSAITRINRTTRERFKVAFDEINIKFKENFPRLFNGGKAELRLDEEADVLEAGIEIVAQPPGKRLQNIVLLSGGEKALTAVALIFSIFLIKPSPFCLLDEVDAPLDDANIDRFNTFVREMSDISQFLLITHSKRTMEMADSLYGVTMEEPGVSKTISVTF
ncbi:MAG: chromosome segregation protein SMC [Proteobacteria bacterium]|nr:chromosome segregation protein SMC [Pseudomonadota bacterium]